jgi:hypothetical protein
MSYAILGLQRWENPLSGNRPNGSKPSAQIIFQYTLNGSRF